MICESLCSDNDPLCHMRKIIIISLDWIALLRRLLIGDGWPFYPNGFFDVCIQCTETRGPIISHLNDPFMTRPASHKQQSIRDHLKSS